jgi:calcium/calmodulin-dependent protein kinase I
MSAELKRDYAIGEEIGRGRFGVVRRCTSRATGEAFAVKSVDRSQLADDLDRELAQLEPKLAQLASAGNPGVVQVHAVYEDEAWTHTVMDLCTGPDLLDWMGLRRGAPVPEPVAAAIVAQLAQALALCHRRGVAHRDVKPDNILIDAAAAEEDEDEEDGRGGGAEAAPRALLADFGSAAWVGAGGLGRAEGLVGTPHYVAPEVVAGSEYGAKADVWSAGVVMYALLSGGALPFVGESAAEVLAAVMRGSVRFPPRLFGSVSPAAKDLMRRMICRDEWRRFTAEQVLGE